MNFHYTNLDTCHTATGVVVVVDVLRAFSNAAYAFARGAREIRPISTVEEALRVKTETPNSLACGEYHGTPPEGFDFGNSPTQTNTLNLTDKIIFQRTSAGTQGIVRSVNADLLLATSFVVANATTKYIRELNPKSVTFVITGQYKPEHGDEDLACAEYIELLLKGKQPDPAPFKERVFKSKDAIQHLDPEETRFPVTDLEYCTDIDIFNFVMLIEKENDLLVMKKTKI